MLWLEQFALNTTQQEAVKSTEGPNLIVAGAGSGKTKVLTTRIAYLIKELGISDRKILAITFTNAAAREMRERVTAMLERENKVFVSTFHSLGLRILRSDINSFGISNSFKVIDEDDMKSSISSIYEKLKVDKEFRKKYAPKNMLGIFCQLAEENCKETENFWDKKIEFPCTPFFKYFPERDVAPIINIYKEYIAFKNQDSILDFTDLINGTIKLLNRFPEISTKWSNYFEYIMVDEFQDTDEKQLELIMLLNNKQNNIFVVGDPDQSIYGWRGAIPDIFNIFKHSFPTYKQILLEQNYRSTKNIIEVANKLIKRNRNRIDKTLNTELSIGKQVVMFKGEDQFAEGRYVVKTIEDLVESKKAKYSDVAILYRANFMSRFIEQELVSKGVPYFIYGGTKFYQRKEIKDIIAYMKLINDFNDDISLKRVINVPNRRIGNATILKISDYAHEKSISFAKAIALKKDGDNTLPWNYQPIHSFINIIERLRKESINEKLEDIINSILDTSGYKEGLKKLDHFQQERMLENINELKNAVGQFSELNETNDIKAFLDSIALYTDIDDSKLLNKKENSVRLMTIHFAKGMEFNVVFMIGLYQGSFPSFRSEIEEERRIAFVGVTRARNELYITTNTGQDYRTQSSFTPSVFIREMDSNNIEHVRPTWKTTSTTDLDFYDSHKQVSYNDVYSNSTRYEIGHAVVHTIFGEGTIVEVNGDLLKIVFGARYGTKTIIGTHKALKRIKL